MAKPYLPQRYKDLVGKEFRFTGNVLSKQREDDFTSKVFDVRLGIATIGDINDKSVRHPSVEYLIQKPGSIRKWSRPFSIEELWLDASNQVIKVDSVCRECGCTDSRACEGGCSWVEPDLCSACVTHPNPASDKWLSDLLQNKEVPNE